MSRTLFQRTNRRFSHTNIYLFLYNSYTKNGKKSCVFTSLIHHTIPFRIAQPPSPTFRYKKTLVLSCSVQLLKCVGQCGGCAGACARLPVVSGAVGGVRGGGRRYRLGGEMPAGCWRASVFCLHGSSPGGSPKLGDLKTESHNNPVDKSKRLQACNHLEALNCSIIFTKRL